MSIKNLIQKFFCLHKWELRKSIEMYDGSFVAHGGSSFYYGTTKQCQCVKCGKWKSFIIK